MFLPDSGDPAVSITYAELDRRARAVARELAGRTARGDRALLVYPAGLDFIVSFFGCLYAGVVAVPTYPPSSRRAQPRLLGILQDARPAVALTTEKLLPRLREMEGDLAALRGLRWLATDLVPPDAAEGWTPPDLSADSLAFLQYTSGSTGAPKGVRVDHGHLLHNEEMIRRAFRQSEESVVLGWLPLYHDMGLIGNVLQPLYTGARCILMSPVAFLQRPSRWLEAISRFRATTSGGPNFAYELCARRVSEEERSGLDLSSWTVAFTGAEPVRAETLDRFAEVFAPCGFRREAFYPCYGLAEATLFVSGGSAGAAPRVRELDQEALERGEARPARQGAPARPLVGCGGAWLGQELCVVDPQTRLPLADGRVGEIWVSGPSVADGYWDRPAESEALFRAWLAPEDGPSGRFLRTGDLGFLDGGELFVTGRLKDLIILRGRNHYPQDVELSAERSHPALRPGCGAAFGVEVDRAEVLVVVFELERHFRGPVEEVAAAVRAVVAGEHGARVHEVTLVRTGTIPKTSSGKIQRQACKRSWLEGTLQVLGRSRAAGADEEAPEAAAEIDRATLLSLDLERRAEALACLLAEPVGRAAGLPSAEIEPEGRLSDYGVDSLVAVDLKVRLETLFGVPLPIARLLEAPTIGELARHIAEGLEQGGTAAPIPAIPSDAEPAGGGHPLSHALSHGQRSLWFLHRLEPASAAYHIVAAVRMEPAPDPEVLRRVFTTLVARHASLRTSFAERDGEPVQRVRADAAPEVLVEDASAWSPAELERRLHAEAYRPFDLESGPLLRLAVYPGAPGGCAVLLGVHHIAADFWSLAVLLREADLLLRQEAGGAPAGLDPLPLRYTDFAAWERRELAGPRGERLWELWRAELAGADEELALTTDRSRPATGSGRGDSRSLRLDAVTAGALRGLARERGATLYATLLAAFQLLLSRSSGQEDVRVGSPAAGRSRPELAGLVGYFTNPLVMRADLAGDPGFGELLERTRRKVFEAFDRQDFPYGLLVERLRREGLGRVPLFQAMLVLQRSHLPGQEGMAALSLGDAATEWTLGGSSLRALPLRRPAQFDLSLFAAEAGDGLLLSLEIAADLFDGTTAERMVGHLRTLAAAAVADPRAPVSSLMMLSDAETAQVLTEWNDTGDLDESGPDACLHDLVAAQAARTPEAVAVVHRLESVTYARLRERAGRLAALLRAMGIVPEARVGIFLERTPDLVAALLGTLEAGGAYVPLDPGHPAERLAFTLADADVRVVLTQPELRSRLPPAGAEVVVLEPGLAGLSPAPKAPAARLSPDHLAYVIYTSGSTGRPKGVAIRHRSAVALLRWASGVFPAEVLAGVLAATSITFDLSVFELFLPLSAGGAVVMARDALELAELPSAADVTLVNTVPSAFAELVRLGAVPASVRTVNLAGEALPAALVEEAFARTAVARVYNLYGPSEDTTYSTFAFRDRGQAGAPPIGRPITGTRAHVLDAALRPVPAGVAGELFLAGAGLARGYLGRPELTSERFLPCPFGDVAGGRMYRTGDLARRLPDGNLDFLGRVDHQVKVRGFRIELGEIEAVLSGHPAVREVAVTAPGEGADRRLAAYAVCEAGQEESTTGLRQWLADRLPAHMVPGDIVLLEALPRTHNGKVDRKALPAPGRQGGGSEAPRNPVEEAVAGVLRELLDLPEVGIHDDFFALGGHSLLAVRLAVRLGSALGTELPVSAVFEAPTVAAMAERLRPATSAPIPPTTTIVRVPRTGPVPLSPAQRRLWVLERLDPFGAAYHLATALHLRGALDIRALAGSLGEIVRRHEALRTVFAEAGGGPMQDLLPAAGVTLPVVDLEALPAEAADLEARRLAAEEAVRPFDLALGPLLRASLVRRSAVEASLLLTLHHAVADGWSLGLLAAELSALYEALSEGRPSPLPEPGVQYADWTVWYLERLAGPEMEAEISWWRSRLAGLPAALELPADRPRPAVRSSRGGTHAFDLGDGAAGQVAGAARACGATPFMVLLGAFLGLLHRYVGNMGDIGDIGDDDLRVGVPVANRTRPEIEGTIGLFVNTLVLRVDFGGDPSFVAALRRVREAALGAFAHPEVPFERLVEELEPERDLGHTPLVQVMFSHQPAPWRAPSLPGLEVGLEEISTGTAKFDLTLAIEETDGELRAQLESSADLFDPVTTERLARHFRSLLEGLLAAPDRRLSDVPLLTTAEREQLVLWSAAPRLDLPAGERLHDRFLAQAALTPDAEALVAGGERLTYGELAVRSDLLARGLRALGVGPEARVAVLLERGPGLVPVLLGVLRAGGAYVPLDRAYPPERIAFVLEDSGAILAVADAALRGRLPDALPAGCRAVSPEELVAAAREPGPERETLPENVAYVLYTSGSTGRPKGVILEHRSAVALVRWAREVLTDEDLSGVLASTPIGFDLSVFEIFATLSWGGRVILAENALELPALPAAGEVIVVNTVPSALAELVRAGGLPPGVRTIGVAGEPLPLSLVRQAYANGGARRVLNLYGPTECTTYSTFALARPEAERQPPIGRPIANTSAAVVDRRGEPVPAGVPGELWLGGAGVARGYLGRPALTAERFVPDPFVGQPGARAYRTGDLVRWRQDGELEFLGRIDHQVKVRGFRIEPGEIAEALARHPGVRESVVVARDVEDGGGGRRLVAYYVADPGSAPRPPELREHLRRSLPEYMVPSVFLLLPRIPRTATGKIDRGALPDPPGAGSAGAAAGMPRQPPATPAQELLAAIWEETLGIQGIGSGDHFFELGGHSLTATRVLARIRAVFGIELPLRRIFERPTLAALALELEAPGAVAEGPELRPAPREARPALSFAQERLWVLDRLEPGSPAYNVPLLVRLTGPLSPGRLRASLLGVARRHEALRTVIAEDDGEPCQAIRPEPELPWEEVDLAGLAEAERLPAALRTAREAALRPFDLALGPLWRLLLLRLGPEDALILLNVHHIVSDGWSMGVLLRETGLLYSALAEGRPADLPALPVQYADFAAWQRERLRGERLETELAHWTRRLDGAPPVLDLPLDRPRPAVATSRGAGEPWRIPPALAEALRALARREGATLFMVLLAAFQSLLSRLSGQEDVCVGTPVSGRRRVETEGLIGFFVDTLVLRTDLAGEPSFRELLGRVREATLEAHAHQELPFERLVEALQPERHLGHQPLFQVMLALQNAVTDTPPLPGLGLEIVDLEPATVRFDLTLSLRETGGGDLGGELRLRTDLFDRGTVRRWGGKLLALLEAGVEDPGRRVHEAPLLTAARRQQVLLEWNDSRRPAASGFFVPERIRRQAQETPAGLAVVCEDDRLTWRELDERACRLAAGLRALGAGPERVVGLLLERSVDAIVALAGVLAAGAAFLPLDPETPRKRLAEVLEDAGALLVLTGTSLRTLLPEPGPRALCLDDEGDRRTLFAPAPLADPGAGPENLAYVIYTSGSTGRPKGVAVEARQLAAYTASIVERLCIEPGMSWATVSTLAADLGHTAVFPALCAGGTLHVMTRRRATDAAAFAEYMERWSVDGLKIVPSHFAALAGTGERLGRAMPRRRLVLGGEAARWDEAERWRAAAPGGCLLFNHYGPTEATVGALTHRIDGGPHRPGTVPLGRPLPGERAFVLDPRLAPVPPGAAGELCLAGAGLARGYLNRPELTAAAFVPDPFAPELGGRLYRTGDLARTGPDGVLEFLGRTDQQVKVRGFRVEPGEVEAALAVHPGVLEVAVLPRADSAGESRLTGYLVPRAGAVAPSLSDLRAFLSERLPDPMLPTALVVLDQLPRTVNGKLDRRRLPAPDAPVLESVTPRTAVEEILAGIWAEVLGQGRFGIHDDFFAVGGHSLAAIRLGARIQGALGVELPLRTLFEERTVAALAAWIEAARRSGAEAPPLLRRSPEAGSLSSMPLSFAQERLWFLDQLAPGNPAYNLPYFARLEGPLSVPALALTLAEVVRRHEPLRTVFPAVEGRPVQVVAAASAPILPEVDLSVLPQEVRETEALRLAAADAAAPFDLARGPLLRILLVRLGAEDARLLLTLHHIVSDAWSRGVLAREVAELYGAAIAGRAATLPELPVRYADYVLWQRSWLRGPALEERLRYWLGQLAGSPPLLDLPLDRPRPAVQSLRGARLGLDLGGGLAVRLRDRGRREGSTLFMTLLAGFSALLSRYARQDDLVIGAPVANRDRSEVAGLIGFFVNLLALRVQREPGEGFSAHLRRVREVALGAYAHQELPFETLVAEMPPARSLSHAPFFQVLLLVEPGDAPRFAAGGLTWSSLEVHNGTAKLDLTLFLRDGSDGSLSGSLEYDADLFDAPTVARLGEHLRSLLAAAAEEPGLDLDDLPLFGEAERVHLLMEWNDTAAPRPAGVCLHEMFEAQAARTPDREAIAGEGRRLSYGELNRRANRLARRLRALGVGPETPVGVCLPRTPDLVVALLAVLKAGGAYVPLDPAYPAERLAFQLSDSGALLRLSSADLGDPSLLAGDGDDLPPLASPDNLAYLIYTSGSTGQPKGVAIEHRSAVGFLAWARNLYSDAELSGVLGATSVCFDLSVFELFAPLSCGGRVILVEDALGLADLPEAGEVRLINTVPSAAAELLRMGALPAAARTVNLAGEQLPRSLVLQLRASGVERIFNLYGPSEDTTYSTGGRMESDRGESDGPPDIGRPLPNRRVYLLGPGLRPAIFGVPGEVFLAGDGLARGYLGRPDVTAERFLPDPFSALPGGRLYRTGDLARYRPDGRLEYLGRLDHQRKVRGFRIEPGEIEAALAACEGVREAVVVVREDTPGDPRLVAYVAGDLGEVAEAALRERLGRALPHYMIPAAFVLLPALPRTPNGKVDRRALPVPGAPAATDCDAVAPRSPVEDILREVFADLLDVPGMGIHDDFFALGGSSLRAAQAVARARQAFQIELPLRAIFQAPTVAQLAQVVTELRSGPERPRPPALERGFEEGPQPLSFAQERLWFLARLDPASSVYHLPLAFRLRGDRGEMDPGVLERCLSELVRRHESLRTLFGDGPDGPWQRIAQPAGRVLRRADLLGLPEGGAEREALRLALAEAGRPFDLSREGPFRALLIELPTERVLLATVHHIAADGWSLGVLARELGRLYEVFAAGRSSAMSPLPEPPVRYVDWVAWQRRRLTGGLLDERLTFWRGHLAGVPPLQLPSDRPRPAVQTFRGATVPFLLEPGTVERLRAFGRERGATLFMSLLGAYLAFTARTADQEDFAVGVPVANRDRVETEGVVGLFVNLLALRADLSCRPGLAEVVRRVQRTVLDAWEHQDLPFEKLVDELRPRRDPGRNPIFQASFQLQDRDGFPPLALPGAEPLRLDRGTAKFDWMLSLIEAGGGLQGVWEHSTDLFDGSTVRIAAERFAALLETALAEPERPLADLPWLRAAERHQLVVEWNATDADFPRSAAVHGIVAAWAARTPDAPAVEIGGRILSYAELSRQARRLARHLRALGVEMEDRVGVCLERSAELVVTFLAVLEAGGVYVPLDPSYPRERLAAMLEDSRARAVVTVEALAAFLPRPEAGLVLLDRDAAAIASQGVESLGLPAGGDHLAYINYTSGSTGRAKGVCIPHRAVLRLVLATDYAVLGPDDRVAQASNASFDAATFEIWGALLNGGCVVGMTRDEMLSPRELAAALAERRVTALFLTTALFNQVAREEPAAFAPLRTVLFGGEACDPQWPRRVLREGPPARLVHVYGPTESTTFATWHRVEAVGPDAWTVPIGRSIANTRTLVMGRDFAPVPAGAPGELWISGDGLARGYLDRPAQTAERFVPDPCAHEPGERAYRSGDLVRRRADGAIEFLGRLDQQVKIRGFRIEPGEIESVLGEHPGVREAVVLAREDVPGERRLVAYIVPREAPPTVTVLRDHVARRLPDHMIPSATVFMESLPLNPNGKVDRRALPAPDAERPDLQRPFVAPRTELESSLAGIWAGLLAVDRIGVEDGFFELGGSSIQAIQVVARAREAGIRLTIRELFEHQSIAALAALVAERDGEEAPAPGDAAGTGASAEDLALAEMEFEFEERSE